MNKLYYYTNSLGQSVICVPGDHSKFDADHLCRLQHQILLLRQRYPIDMAQVQDPLNLIRCQNRSDWIQKNSSPSGKFFRG